MRNSPNRLLLAVLAAFKVGVSYALFALFGGLCAFVFFGFFGKPPYGLKLEDDSAFDLANFFESAQSRDIAIDGGDISKNINGLTARYGTGGSFAAVPSFSIIGEDALAFTVPVCLGGFGENRVFFLSFCVDSSLNLKEAYFGAGRVPVALAKAWARKLLSHYEASAFLKKRIDAFFSGALELKVGSKCVFLKKCD